MFNNQLIELTASLYSLWTSSVKVAELINAFVQAFEKKSHKLIGSHDQIKKKNKNKNNINPLADNQQFREINCDQHCSSSFCYLFVCLFSENNLFLSLAKGCIWH